MSNLRATLLAPDLGFSTNQVLPGVIGGATPTSSAMMLGSEVNSLNSSVAYSLINTSLPVISSSPIGSIAPAGAVTGAHSINLKDTLKEIRAPVGAVANDTLKEIQLLIDDARPTMGVVDTLQRIRVKYIDSEDCEEGRLSGSARIGVPAHFNKSYTEYFVQITANEPLVFETQLLVIPKNDRLNLRVLRIPQADIRPVDPEINWDSLIDGASASVATGSAPRTKEPTDRELEWKAPGSSTKGWSPNFLKFSLKKPLVGVVWGLKKPLSDKGGHMTAGVLSDLEKPLLGQDYSDFSLKKPHFGQQNCKFLPSKSHFCGPSFGGASRGLEWIKAEIKVLPGYAKFEANRNKPLQNIDRVEHWTFAFNADKKFYKSDWPSDISTSKITKVPIQLALQMGSTMLAEAIQIIGIIDCYTTEGIHYSAEVVAQISKSDEKDLKATVLKGFLIQWEKDHPVTK
ncbi:hypothetical protein DFH07DRAFT_784853 [Mycena maculata]|uniref:Uncharacterized protein n=1 Tax=Mycena maculata TaxID=230809 RepID=A0AAD7MIA2_9AGAR|nr:hypothetical protein DFH07DRAFT_784853 [Mycena maculata]